MSDKSVLFVGLSADEMERIALPGGVVGACVNSCTEALDLLALTPPTLVVANHKVGGEDSLEFFTRAWAAGSGLSAPIVFVAPPGSGVQPFVYQRRRVGFEVRYMEAGGELHTHFVHEVPQEKDYTIRALDHERLGDEITRLVLGQEGPPAEPPGGDAGARALDVGFNQVVTVGGARYHVQTEVVEAKPLTIATTVTLKGRAVHATRQRLKPKGTSLDVITSEVERIHQSTLKRVSTGELK